MTSFRKIAFKSSFWEQTISTVKLQHIGWSFIRMVLVIGICFIILYPLFIKISTSLMTEQDLFDLTVRWIPRHFNLSRTVSHYIGVAEAMQYSRAFLNSFLLALSVSIAQLMSCTIIGYGLARFEFRGSGLLFAMVIFTLLVPPQMMMIPLFLNFRFFDFFGLLPGTGWNLVETYWPFILTALTGTGFRNGLFIYIMRQHFKGTPRDLEEAAYVDGAGQFRTFAVIMLPGATAVLLVVFLFSFVWQWNDIFLTSLFMDESTPLLPLTLQRLPHMRISTDPHGGIYGVGYEYSPEYMTTVINTGMVLFLAPILILYAVLQRYFIESVQRTGIVG